jgi:hypothetical protein
MFSAMFVHIKKYFYIRLCDILAAPAEFANHAVPTFIAA